jgi:hypothetical protein
MLIVTPNGKRRYIDLAGKSVRFGAAVGAATIDPAKLDRFVALNRIINPPNASPQDKATLIARTDTAYATNVACEMFLPGGTLHLGDDSELNYFFEPVLSTDIPLAGRLPINMKWSPGVTELQIVLTYVDSFSDAPTPTLGQETITVDERSKVFVFNFDEVRPDVGDADSNDVNCSEPGKEIEDDDFKWLYQLINKPQSKDSVAQWLADSPFPKQRLPAPLTVCPKPSDVPRTRSPDTSTCFFRTWDEDQ